MRKIFIVLISLAVVIGMASAHPRPTAADQEDHLDPSGRIVAARGSLETLSGMLKWEDDEWHLALPSGGIMYELHLGPYGHREEPVFTDNTSAEVEGFVYRDHISPVKVITGGETYQFWTTERMPMWAGSGEGGGRVAWEYGDIPQGQRFADGENAYSGNSVQTGPREDPDARPRLGEAVNRQESAGGAPGGALERMKRNSPDS